MKVKEVKCERDSLELYNQIRNCEGGLKSTKETLNDLESESKTVEI